MPDIPVEKRNGRGRRAGSGTAGKQDTRTPSEKDREFEDGIAGVIVIAMWAGIAWAATTMPLGPWYIPTAGAIILGGVMRWALVNPLRFILVWLRRLVLIAVAVAVIAAVLFVVSHITSDRF